MNTWHPSPDIFSLPYPFHPVLSIPIVYTHTFKIHFFFMDFPTSLQKFERTPSSRLTMNTFVIYFLYMVLRAEQLLPMDKHSASGWSPVLGAQMCEIPSAEFLVGPHLPQMDAPASFLVSVTDTVPSFFFFF